jgi:hypothetical protein
MSYVIVDLAGESRIASIDGETREKGIKPCEGVKGVIARVV